MKFSIKDLFSKCDQIRSFLQIWSHLLKKSLMGNLMCSVNDDPAELHTGKNKAVINNFKYAKQISSKWQTLLPDKLKTAAFHLLSKIHKPNNRGKPALISMDCLTNRISEFVDHYLQQAVKNLKSYVKDTSDFIKKLENFHLTNEFYISIFHIKKVSKR